MTKGLLTECIKKREPTRNDNDDEEYKEPVRRLTNRVVAGLIEAVMMNLA